MAEEILPIPRVEDPEKWLYGLNCRVDKGGTPEGCHTEPFKTFAELKKHSDECHKNVKIECDHMNCHLKFSNLEDKLEHEGFFIFSYNMTHIQNSRNST